MSVIAVYSLSWLGLLALAILNGTVRDLGYARALGELRAQQLSTLAGLVLFSAYLGALARLRPIERDLGPRASVARLLKGTGAKPGPVPHRPAAPHRWLTLFLASPSLRHPAPLALAPLGGSWLIAHS